MMLRTDSHRDFRLSLLPLQRFKMSSACSAVAPPMGPQTAFSWQLPWQCCLRDCKGRLPRSQLLGCLSSARKDEPEGLFCHPLLCLWGEVSPTSQSCQQDSKIQYIPDTHA